MMTPSKFSADSVNVAPDVEATFEAVSPAPTLITEHEVAFATAAAALVPSPTMRWWTKAIHAFRTALWTRQTSTADSRSPRRVGPRRYTYLENACMSREMDRL